MSASLVAVTLWAAWVPSSPLTGRMWSHAGMRLVQVEVDGDHLYALARRDPDPVLSPKSTGGAILLLRCPLRGLNRGSATAESFYLQTEEPPFHWRMKGGVFWAASPRVGSDSGFYRIPIDQFPPPNLSGDSPEYREKYGPRESEYSYLCPEEARQARGGNIGFGAPMPFEAWSHIVPAGKDTPLLILRRESAPENPENRGPDVVEVYRGDIHPIKEGKYKGRFFFTWEKVESLPAEFRGDFQVRRRGEDYYLILESGQVYLARKPAKGQQRKLEEVWGKDRPPITAILTDSDHDEVYLFGKAKQKDGKPFFFPLSAKPQPKEFDPDVFARGPVDEPLRSAFGMARAAGLAKDSPREKVPAPRP